MGILLLLAGLACLVDGDYVQFLTCSKSPTGPGGFGITVPCGSGSYFAGPTFQEPTVLTSSNGLLTANLSVQYHRLNATKFSFMSRAFCIIGGACSVPGPTLKVKPGDTLVVNLRNDLPPNPPHPSPMNTMNSPNTINFHTHGLHVDPSVDNVFVQLTSGQSMTYTLTINSTHLPGLHWYHSHHHGSAAYHMMGGLLGAVIVDIPSTNPAPASYAAMASNLMVFTHHPLCSCNPTTDPFRIISLQDMHNLTADPLALDIDGGTGISDVYLVNGQFQPRLTLKPKEWRRFEMVNSVADTYLELEIRTAVNGGGTSACTLYLLAIDGVFLTATRKITFFLMAIGSRASIAVMCSTAGTYYLQSNPLGRASDLEAGFKQNLVTLTVTGTAVTMATPTLSFKRPYYLNSLLTYKPVGKWEIGVEETLVTPPARAWLGVGKNCTLPCSGRGCVTTVSPNNFGECYYTPYGGVTMNISHVGRLCSVEELVINGRGRTPHPIHIHTNHFQIVSAQDTATLALWGVVGDWRDTMPALVGKTVVRYVLGDFGGSIIMHCHFLTHEDSGMMNRFWVDNNAPFCVASGGGSTSLPRQLCDSGVSSSAWTAQYTSIKKFCSSIETATGFIKV